MASSWVVYMGRGRHWWWDKKLCLSFFVQTHCINADVCAVLLWTGLLNWPGFKTKIVISWSHVLPVQWAWVQKWEWIGDRGEGYSVVDLITEDGFELTLDINWNERFWPNKRQKVCSHNGCALVQDTWTSSSLHSGRFSGCDCVKPWATCSALIAK